MRMIENAAKVISETQKVNSTPYKASKKSDMKQIIWRDTISYLRWYLLTLHYNDLLKKKYIYTCIITTLQREKMSSSAFEVTQCKRIQFLLCIHITKPLELGDGVDNSANVG